jgi:hypothetical protein
VPAADIRDSLVEVIDGDPAAIMRTMAGLLITPDRYRQTKAPRVSLSGLPTQTGLRVGTVNLGNVKIEIGRIIPETNKQTTTARRKRLRQYLTTLLEPHGGDEADAVALELVCLISLAELRWSASIHLQ